MLDFISAVSFLFLFGVGIAACYSKRVRKSISVVNRIEEEINRRMKRKNLLREIDYYTYMIEKGPEDRWKQYDYLDRGVALRKIGRDNEALKDFDKAIELSPIVTFAYSNKAFIFEERGSYEQAIENYTKAIESASYGAGGYYWYRGNLYEKIGKIKEAYDDFCKARDNFVQNIGVRVEQPGLIGMCCAKIYELDYSARQQREQEELEARFSKASQN